MTYYNNNYRTGQRPSMMTCPNRPAQPPKCAAGCGSNSPKSVRNMGRTPCNSCLGEPRTTPAQGAAQSCVMVSPSCPVAMAYVPFQAFEELFDEKKAFMVGTVFPSMFKPFLAGGKCR